MQSRQQNVKQPMFECFTYSPTRRIQHSKLISCVRRFSTFRRQNQPKDIKIYKTVVRLSVQIDKAIKAMSIVNLTMATFTLDVFTATFPPINPLYWVLRVYCIRVTGLWTRRLWKKLVLQSMFRSAGLYLENLWLANVAYIINLVKHIIKFVKHRDS